MINLHYEVAPHDQPISSIWLWLRMAGQLQDKRLEIFQLLKLRLLF